MRKLITLAIVLVFIVAAVLLALAFPANAAAVCPTGWGSTPETATAMSPAPIDQVRAGRHACYDRLVFDVSGAAGGYSVAYVPTVFSEGRGAPLDVPGGARLSVSVHDPLSHVSTISAAPWPMGTPMVDVSGFRTLRGVVYGGSFEGYSQFGVGVRARLPFRVSVAATRGGVSRIVLDVAHSWS